MSDPYFYQVPLDSGEYMRISIPRELTASDVDDIDRLLALALRQAHRRGGSPTPLADVRCPCGHVFDKEALRENATTWGNAGEPQDWECPDCDRVLCVTEYVSRTYEVETVEPGEPKGESR